MLTLLCVAALFGVLTACDKAAPAPTHTGTQGSTGTKPTEHVHTFGDWTLFNEGETDCEKKVYCRTCSGCGIEEKKNGQYEDHNWTTVTTQPTCQAGGYDTKTCQLCGKVETCNETPKAAHAYNDTYNSDSTHHWRDCANCVTTADRRQHVLSVDGTCSVCAALIPPTEGVEYELSKDKTYAVVADYSGTASRVMIAAEYEGVPVKEIGASAFWRSNITAVVIPDSVTTIGSSAFFSCSNLTIVGLPEGLTTIGSSAFHRCTRLASIIIPESVTHIDARAFSDCSSLTNIILPEGITAIDDYVFENCTSLTDITIPESVTAIGLCAFNGCTSLTGITIPASVTAIGECAFDDCDNLTTVTFAENIQLASIGESAFRNCTDLFSITIPASVTSISADAFYDCSSLESVTFAENSQLASIGEFAFSNCISLTGIILPESVTTIGTAAFHGCTNLTSITLPEGITFIGRSVFYDCHNLADIYFAGTMAQWEAITKDSYWADFTGEFVIHCTDGDLTKS